MNTKIGNYKQVYFIGIGGIGMSALARYFKLHGLIVNGYDKTPSPLIDELKKEDIDVHFEDLGVSVQNIIGTKDESVVIYTPAVPHELGELVYLKNQGYNIMKRAHALGLITQFSRGLTVAGTHGKTTTSTLLAHILHNTVGCSAFLGGISTNYQTNYLGDITSPFTVIEADEFDRSFLQLSPYSSIITSVDADHLDIYGDASHFRQGFEDFAKLINEKGHLVQKIGLNLHTPASSVTYALNQKADYYADNCHYENGTFKFDLHTPNRVYKSVELGIPGYHNAENATACVALCDRLEFDLDKIIPLLATFKGVKRRFEYHVKSQNIIYIDDYAHHPTEIHALVSSIKLLYPTQHKIGIFQPHLYTRTRDFMDAFAKELSELDEIILLPIYPAREQPIDGINSEGLLKKIKNDNKKVLSKETILAYIKTIKKGVVVTIGAGDIDRLIEPIKKNLESNLHV